MNQVVKGFSNIYEYLGIQNDSDMQFKATIAAKIGEIVKHRNGFHLASNGFRISSCQP